MRISHRVARPVVALAALLVLGGCATINYTSGLGQAMVSLNRAADLGAYERVGSFETSQRAVFVIASLITVVDANVEQAVGRELARTGGDAVVNLRIHEEYDIIDFAIGAAQLFLLFGAQIVNTRSITLRGDVVRWTTGGPEPEALDELADLCRALDVVSEDGTRAGRLCIESGAGVAFADR